MRKLIWLMHRSLDGFVSGPNGEMDWAGASKDDELWEDVYGSVGHGGRCLVWTREGCPEFVSG